MQTKTALFAAAAALAALTISSRAEQPPADPARIAAAQALVNAMGGEMHARATVAGLKVALVKHVAATEPAKVVGFNAYMEKELAPSSPRVTSYLSDVGRIAVEFYAQRFTTEELNQITAFQNSEAGRKFQALTPELGHKIAQRSMAFQTDLLRTIDQGAAAGK